MKWADVIQLLRESVITQAVITLMMGGVIVYMLVTERVVPSELWALNGLVVGFYFGGKVQAQAMRIARLGEGGHDGQTGRSAGRGG